jgi:hypothetical protein
MSLADRALEATQHELDRRRAAKHAAGHPPEARYVDPIEGERIEGVGVRLPMSVDGEREYRDHRLEVRRAE